MTKNNGKRMPPILIALGMGFILTITTIFCLAGSTLLSISDLGPEGGPMILIFCVPPIGIFIGIVVILSISIHNWYLHHRKDRELSIKYYLIWAVAWLGGIVFLTLLFAIQINGIEFPSPIFFVGTLIIVAATIMFGALAASWLDRRSL